MMMRDRMFDINGGAEVQNKAFRRLTNGLILIPVLLLLFSAPQAFAQGSIFGSVTNSDASVPANGEITFVGYLDDTDEEIRLETAIGAGYDNGNWFDDFQNYLTEAAGNPYDYHFYNTANGEYAVLSGPIPNNSFQQEDIVLAPYAGSTIPTTGLTGRALSSSTVVISWVATPGLTYHVYRRLATSTGSFFRIDDPTGSLANRGVAVNYFVDNTVDGSSSYHYLVIPEDDAGNLGPMHSAILTVNSANLVAPVATAVNPNNGPYVGGTSVTITGSNFDVNGVSVTIGGNPLTSVTVNSPYQITGLTPAGIVGAADVIITNAASALVSNVLTGGFTYNGNTPPAFDPIGPIAGTEGVNVNFNVTANDVDGTTPALSAAGLPTGATFVDNGDGTGTFDWLPSYTDAGLHTVTFTADDGIEPTNLPVDINIADAGNQPPVVDPIADTSIAENETLNLVISASDPDLDQIFLSVTDAPANSNFTDNGDGTAAFDFTPDFTQTGTYPVIFKAFDGTLVDSIIVGITVTNVNQAPILTAIGAQSGTEGINLNFGVTATDPDGDPITLSAADLPVGATFTDNGDGTGVFDWTPGFTEAGTYQVTFSAADASDNTDEIVDITIAEAGNQTPVLDPIGPQAGTEGVNISLTITASDPDGTIPALTALNLPTGATLTDNGDGTATFDWTPGFNDAGLHSVTFQASDGTATAEEVVEFTIGDSGNQVPVIDPIADTTIAESDSLIMVVTASDPEGGNVLLTVSAGLPITNYNFVDSGNGVGVLSVGTDYFLSGSYTVTFFATDMATPPATSSQDVTVNITEVNQPPTVAEIGPVGVAAGDNLTFTVEAFDSTSPNPNPRVFLSMTGLPTNAVFLDNGDNTGTFTFDPDFGQVGVYNVTLIATDQGTPQLTTQLPIEITVVTENQPPIFAEYPQSLSGDEGTTISLTVSATDGDGNIPTLYSIKIPENSTFTDNGDGTGDFVFNPSFVQAGLFQVVLAAYDGVNETRTDPILIQVIEAGNQAPQIDPVTQQTVTEGTNLSYTVTASDPDGTTPTLSAENLPANMTFTDNGDGTGTISFDPAFSQSGSYDVTIIADDGESQDTIIVTVVVEDAGNQPPVLTPVDPQTVAELQTLNFTVTATDPDSDVPDIPVMTAIDVPTGATYVDNGDGTGTFNWETENLDVGVYPVSFIATDPRDATLYDSIEVSITVTDYNVPPYGVIIEGQLSTRLYEGETVSITFAANDDDGTTPSIEIVSSYSLAQNMTLDTSEPGIGVLTFSPDFTQGGDGEIAYGIQFILIDEIDPDLTNRFPAQPIQFIVDNLNRPPVLATTANSLDTSMVEGETMEFQVSVSDPDNNNSGFLLVAEDLPQNATFSGIQNTKLFSFTPDYTQAGVYPIRFIATDIPGGGDTPLSDTLEVTITVNEAGNQAPEFTVVTAVLPPDRQPIVIGELHTTNLTVTDPDMDIVTITMTNSPTDFADFTFTDNGDNTATLNVTGTSEEVLQVFSVTYTATDPGGLSTDVNVEYLVAPFIRGDANSDGQLDMSDIMYILNYIFKDGPAPASMEAADADFNNVNDFLDALYLIQYFYKKGPPPPLAPSTK